MQTKGVNTTNALKLIQIKTKPESKLFRIVRERLLQARCPSRVQSTDQQYKTLKKTSASPS